MVIFCFTLIIQFNELIGLANELIFNKISSLFLVLSNSTTKIIITVSILVIITGVSFFLRKNIALVLKGKFGKIIKGVGEGLGSIRKTKSPIRFILLSLLIWASYFYSLYACFFALEGTSHLGQKECLSLLLFGTLGVIFAPGGLGAYPIILYTILVGTYNVTEASAFALPWLSWTSQFVLILFLGIVGLIVLPLYNKNKNVVS
jgi:hypothetical protein